jgi:hypothetical protein
LLLLLLLLLNHPQGHAGASAAGVIHTNLDLTPTTAAVVAAARCTT